MRRRDFITLLGGAAAAWPLAARAQSDTVRRIGILVGVTMNDIQKEIVATLQGLGWIDGRNVRIDYRTTAGSAERTCTNAAELVRLSPDAILVAGAIATRALQDMTRTVPIVFWNVADPVAGGFVGSLAHPGGNMTGFSNFKFSIGGEWLVVLKEIALLLRELQSCPIQTISIKSDMYDPSKLPPHPSPWR
jgi:putative tryptophan/tyrosine transport system substrate-binding protein